MTHDGASVIQISNVPSMDPMNQVAIALTRSKDNALRFLIAPMMQAQGWSRFQGAIKTPFVMFRLMAMRFPWHGVLFAKR